MAEPSAALAPWKPTPAQLAAAEGKTLADVIAPNLPGLFVGINPSLYSAAVSHHFARPGNRFWPALHQGELTPRQLSPFEDWSLTVYGWGITNLAARATARADQLTTDELQQGAEQLEKKVRRLGIRCVAFLGVTAYRAAFDQRHATVGQQDRQLADAAVWLLPNPSGLNAHYQRKDFAQLFAELRRFVSGFKSG